MHFTWVSFFVFSVSVHLFYHMHVPASHEDVFVREMLIHGRPERAARAAFPYMLTEYIPDAVIYMMENPEITRRIDAGFLYMYRDYAGNIEIPKVAPITDEDRIGILKRITSRMRKRPQYIRDGHCLAQIMIPYTEDEINAAENMLDKLLQIDNAVAF